MMESRQSRIARLREIVSGTRSALEILKLANRNAPERMRDSFVAKIGKVERELQELESELHELNVQQIRHELGQHRESSDH